MKSRREQRHSSIIYRKNKPVEFGYNTIGFHAEEDAVNRLWNKQGYNNRYNFSDYIMINLRITPGGKIGNSKPCPACLELLKIKKFRKVIYSTNEGTFEEIIL